MRRYSLLLIIFAILASSAMAAPQFYVNSADSSVDVFPGEYAYYNVTITNLNNNQDVVYIIDIFDSRFSIVNPNQVKVPRNSTKEFTMIIQPTSTATLGPNGVNVKFSSGLTEEFREVLFTVNIRPWDPIFGEYRPSVQFQANIDKEVDPRKKMPVEIFMRNRNALDISDMEISIDGQLFQDTVIEALGPLEEKRTEYLFELDPLQEPGPYTLDVIVKVRNITISRSTQTYEIQGYATITQDSVQENFLFKNTETILIENVGNAERVKTINLAMPWTKRLFTSSEPNAVTTKSDGKTVLQWELRVEPQELTEIVVVTNYRIPIILVLLIILGVVLYFRMRSPLIVSKEAFITGGKEEGAEHLKIRIFVKNRTAKPVENVMVYDRIPGIAEYVKQKVLGTIQPEQVTKQEKKGTKLKYNLESLEAFEERIITYNIKSKLKIIGNISLPSTKVTFSHRGVPRSSLSQKIIVSN